MPDDERQNDKQQKMCLYAREASRRSPCLVCDVSVGRTGCLIYPVALTPAHDHKVPSRWKLYRTERMDSDKLLWADSVIGVFSEQSCPAPFFQSLQGHNTAFPTVQRLRPPLFSLFSEAQLMCCGSRCFPDNCGSDQGHWRLMATFLTLYKGSVFIRAWKRRGVCKLVRVQEYEAE